VKEERRLVEQTLGELASLTTIDSANFFSFVSSLRVSSLPV